MANRRQQIEALQKKAEELAGEVRDLHSELEDALENMPESLQYGPNGERAQERIDLLDTWAGSLEEIAEEAFE